ncbi:unnamed protein product [Acanthoscelides obtectus]|uniref:Uncharacterized protein n=1 Tax=Acanthoscelides obtectus TaxID=200917 RepID=A0A9P0Q6N2_ACAOB|nr:unnamed protein product [Acanthoscelides obtectus]CAK1677019.1 hypothetical protein AOBTE_LOCUS31070 [Acanthoscelides obtectus]
MEPREKLYPTSSRVFYFGGIFATGDPLTRFLPGTSFRTETLFPP